MGLPDLLVSSVRRYGVMPTTLVVTVLSVLISMAVTALVVGVFWGEVELDTLAVAATVAAVNAPLFGYAQLRTFSKLERARSELQRLADTDGLTGVHNRRYFLERLNDELERLTRYGGALSVVLFDIDDFKKVNDGYGHSAGDEVLKAVAACCLEGIRQPDVFARYGGEEFAFLLPQTDAEQARLLAERLRSGVAALELHSGEARIRLTVSIGVASASADTSADRLLKGADDALYQAKRLGKNRVEGATSLPAVLTPAAL